MNICFHLNVWAECVLDIKRRLHIMHKKSLTAYDAISDDQEHKVVVAVSVGFSKLSHMADHWGKVCWTIQTNCEKESAYSKTNGSC